MLNYLNKCVYLPKIVPLELGSRDVLVIRGVHGGVWYGRGEMKAPHMGILTKKMCVPPI